MKQVTCVSPINIAVIKYWGKKDEELNIPLNSSISVTLNPEDLCSTTSVAVSDQYDKDLMWLNGKSENVEKNKRLQNCLNAVTNLQLKRKYEKEHTSFNHQLKYHIASTNNFPTAAGLASSASGYACLVDKCFLSREDKNVEFAFTNLGSGSASRSMYGGFVKWERGRLEDGSDSRAHQIVKEDWWPDLNVLILVVNNKQKSVGSTEGMKRSVATSSLLKYRSDVCVEERLTQMESAILRKDFQQFALLTMKDSNQLHAICQDTYPPLIYMNQTSHDIVHFVTALNQNETKVAYTFDAGPNAVLFTLDMWFDELLATILKYFPFNNKVLLAFCHNHSETQLVYPIKYEKQKVLLQRPINMQQEKIKDLKDKAAKLNGINIHSFDTLKQIIVTKAGRGAHEVSNNCSLLDEDGYPK